MLNSKPSDTLKGSDESEIGGLIIKKNISSTDREEKKLLKDENGLGLRELALKKKLEAGILILKRYKI